jgi:hypothetical protein
VKLRNALHNPYCGWIAARPVLYSYCESPNAQLVLYFTKYLGVVSPQSHLERVYPSASVVVIYPEAAFAIDKPSKPITE